jgi:hypothetical protein
VIKDTNNITTEIFSGLTDEIGKFSFELKLAKNTESGTYSVSLDIIATEYKLLAKTKTFNVENVNDTTIT